jgi:aminomethyltransferase
LKFFSFNPDIEVDGKKAIVSRTGYTGEDGFEIYIDPEYAPMIWDKLLVAGKDNGLVPVGLGARDTLRFEVALPLYGQEISQDITPLEASLERFVKLDKDDFIGKQALAKQKEEGLKRKITGFEMVDRGIPRSRYEVQVNGKNIGFVTTGSFSPSLEKNIGLALIDIEYSQTGTELDIVIRNRPLKARTVKTPFYTKKYK